MLLEPHYTISQFKYQANRNFQSREGYQRFDVDFSGRRLVPADKLAKKSSVVGDVIRRAVRGHTVLDIGCDKGYFSWVAVDGGASHVVANDVNHEVLRFLDMLARIMRWPIKPVKQNLFLTDSKVCCDYVLALAVIHQIAGVNMEEAIRRIRSLCRVGAIVEFCEDYQQKFGPAWNHGRFRRVVSRHFSEARCVAQYRAVGKYKGLRYVYELRC